MEYLQTSLKQESCNPVNKVSPTNPSKRERAQSVHGEASPSNTREKSPIQPREPLVQWALVCLFFL